MYHCIPVINERIRHLELHFVTAIIINIFQENNQTRAYVRVIEDDKNEEVHTGTTITTLPDISPENLQDKIIELLLNKQHTHYFGAREFSSKKVLCEKLDSLYCKGAHEYDIDKVRYLLYNHRKSDRNKDSILSSEII